MKRIKKLTKNSYLRIKFYRPYGHRHFSGHSLAFIIDDDYHKQHPGLVDRFKAIIGVYYIAKKANRDFYLCYNTPFSLQKYLLPNKVDWAIKRENLCKNVFLTGLLTYDAKEKLPQLNPVKPEYHCYYYLGHNLLKEHNNKGWEKEWNKQFWELFKPSQYLEKLLDDNVPKVEYTAVHFRFLNALDEFEEGVGNQLDEKGKNELIQKCLCQIEKIQHDTNKHVCVFSDSSRFLKIAQKQGYMILKNADSIGHITFSSSDDAHDKTFIDFFAISRSKKVYAIRGEHLYNSVYPQYAAIVGGCDFEILQLD